MEPAGLTHSCVVELFTVDAFTSSAIIRRDDLLTFTQPHLRSLICICTLTAALANDYCSVEPLLRVPGVSVASETELCT